MKTNTLNGAIRLPGLEERVPGADQRATEVVVNVIKTSGLIEDAVAAHLRPHGLSGTSFNTLMILEGSQEPLCPSEIGERLLVTRGTMTGVLDSLEKRGLIVRRPDERDRRMLRIELTDKARALLNEIVPTLHRCEAELLAHLSATDKESLVRLLGKTLSGLTP